MPAIADAKKVEKRLRALEIILARLLADAGEDTIEKLREDLTFHQPPHVSAMAAIDETTIGAVQRMAQFGETLRARDTAEAAKTPTGPE